MIAVILVGLIALVLVFCVKGLFWSGPFPPNSGWSKRQLDRMEQGRSPWTFAAWATHSVERSREIKGAGNQ